MEEFAAKKPRSYFPGVPVHIVLASLLSCQLVAFNLWRLLAARYCLSPPPAAPRVPRCSHLIAGPRGAGLQVTHFYTHTSSINTEEKLSYPHLLIVWTIVHSNVPFQKHISVNLHFSKLQWTFTMKGNKLPSSALVDVTQNNII